MKYLLIHSIVISCIFFSFGLTQNNFDANAYSQFLQENQNLSFEEIQEKFNAKNSYYKGHEDETNLAKFSYLDSIQIKLGLSDQEIELLRLNHFVVSERLSYNCFGEAFHNIYVKDLPVFISSDAILHALHASYDQILIDLEISILEPNLYIFLDGLYSSFPQVMSKYSANDKLQDALKDVDLYITIAKSLLAGTKLSPQLASQKQVDDMWTAIQSEKLSSMPLFSERDRKLDFSQFTVRGHYNNERLKDYFKAMMWLGRMDFMLTPPPENPWEDPWSREEIRRMNLGAFILNELIDLSADRTKLEQNEEIICFMVGESDNLTPGELSTVIASQNLNSAEQLLDDPTYDTFQSALKESNGAEQKILSQFMMMDPFSSEPGELPVSFRLMGQRFIIDSYILFNVVYDRIIYEDEKIWRPMPDPLDALFVLGNENALPLLKEELEMYKYSSQLSALRYLVDSYDPEFWQTSLYTVWLQAIRALNPPLNRDGFPFFMKTTAWQQCKINTQLASWSQLRHDNLLYAKQSYTGATGCSFPYSFIEPNPDFYARIAAFAEKAETYFSHFQSQTYEMSQIKMYFPGLKSVMNRLENIARKELSGQPLDNDEIKWLKEMLFEDGQSGAPPFSGWYPYLYYHADDAALSNYIIADVHTQPTDYAGNIVGRVLHVGTAAVNLGIFLAESGGNHSRPVAFIGPVMSYYEKISKDFDRLTDERWTQMVDANELPKRPDWVNIYLADNKGNKFEAGRELPSVVYTGEFEEPQPIVENFKLHQNYPNPFNPITNIEFQIPDLGFISLIVYNTLGQKVATLLNEQKTAGSYEVEWNASGFASGVYFYKLQSDKGQVQTRKLLLLK